MLLVLILCANIASSQAVDTLIVYQNDTTVFNSTGAFVQWPCRKPEFHISYEIKTPVDSAYYFIYNEEKQLAEEGIYQSKLIDGVSYNGMLDSKYYRYHKNGKLYILFYKENGRTVKAEFYNKRGKFKEVKVY